MATGSLYAGRCYSSQDEAFDAFVSSAVPTVTPGATSYLHRFEFSGSPLVASSVTMSKALAGDWVLESRVLVSSPGFAPCDSDGERFLDGVFIGWLIVGLMAGMWGWKKTREQIR